MQTLTFVTLASNAYWLGFAALVESIRINSGLELAQYKFLAYSTDPITDWVLDWSKQRPEKIEFCVGEELNDFVSLSTQRYERLSVSIKKLGLFGIQHQGTDRHIFIDSDMLCLGSLKDIFDFEPFAGVPNSRHYLETIDGSDGTDHINGGFFIFEPSTKDRYELFSIYRNDPEKFTQFGDQDVFAEWVRQGKKVNFMPSEWNCMKGLLVPTGKKLNRSQLAKVRLLHFTGDNPWNIYAGIRLSEGRFFQLEQLWWHYLKQSNIQPTEKKFRQLNKTIPYKRWALARINFTKNRIKRGLKKLCLNHSLI